MGAVTQRAKPYQLALLIKKSLDDIIGPKQRACEATVEFQYKNIDFCLIHDIIAES